MRTQKEIIDRIKSRKKEDCLAFEWPYYLGSLPFESAKQFLKDGVTENDWEQKTEDAIRSEAIKYMPFAWKKANGCRGISASRSISHYVAWMWLLGHDNTERWEDYEYYGKPQLIEICELLNIDPAQWDDGIRVN